MTAKHRPDDIPDDQISIRRPGTPIEDGPFHAWNPTSWTTHRGGGSGTGIGPGGRPVSTVRLENFHDGLEDFASGLVPRRRSAAGKQGAGLSLAPGADGRRRRRRPGRSPRVS